MNTIKAGKKGGMSHKNNYNRIAANAHAEYEETPLDFNLGSRSSPHAANAADYINFDMLAAICQQVMRVMKGKQHTNDNNGAVSTSFTSFVGIDLQSFSCSMIKQHENDN